MTETYTEIRCTNCRTLLLEADIRDGKFKKICPKCKTVNVVKVEPQKIIPAGQSFQERIDMRRK